MNDAFMKNNYEMDKTGLPLTSVGFTESIILKL